MLSVLIPTYNNACTALVQALIGLSQGVGLEIIVAEDGTTDALALASNRWIGQMPHCRYLPLADNHGRAAIRNILAREARGNRLLFLDDDVSPAGSDFFTSYLSSASPVVCGGVRAAAKPRSDNLRWRYDHAAEHGALSVESRKANPYRCFATSNFMIDREVFLSILFDENITGYGYEDALFGRELQRRGIAIEHIHNPVYHNGLDDNADFLRKAEQALVTLSRLPRMQQYASVAVMARRTRLLAPVLRHLCPLLRPFLVGRHPQVWTLQMYKLCYYHNIKVPK